MEHENYSTVQDISRGFSVYPSTVYRWIQSGKLIAEKQGNRYLIPFEGNREFFLSRLKIKGNKPEKAWIPKELDRYNSWHEMIDEFSWLVKICYSSKEEIKKKKFRLDQLFANYIKIQKIAPEKISGIFTTNILKDKIVITDDLKRGWYNELAYSFPIKKTTLGLSFDDISINKDISEIRFSFPSWRIIVSYYSVYFYIRSIVLMKQNSLRIREHSATITSFKNNVLQPLSRVLWKFPFNIIYLPDKRMKNEVIRNDSFEYLKYKYCVHPRPPNYTARQIVERIFNTYKKNAKKSSKKRSYMLFDYLHDFRIWANYLDIDNLLNLWGPGYKAFLDQNLALLLFFIGGFSEICYLSVFNQKGYISEIQKFYDLFISNNLEVENDFENTPIYQRHLLYYQLGWIKNKIKLRKPENPNRIIRISN